MFYAPKHSARKVNPVRRRVTGVAVAGVATVTGGMATATSAQAATVWDRVAACESGGNWAINTGNGYYGGLQMNMDFWRSYGARHEVTHDDGSVTLELDHARPDLASRSEQIAAAERARDSGRGYGPWECKP
jgi:hypothetical protein